MLVTEALDIVRRSDGGGVVIGRPLARLTSSTWVQISNARATSRLGHVKVQP